MNIKTQKHKNNILKRCIAILLTVLMVMPFCTACGASPSGSGKLNIVATIFPQYDFARAIAGELADITMLLSPGAETHSYEPTPKDIKNIENCDIFIYVGGESDSWIDSILDSIDTSKMKIISLMNIVEPLEEEHDGEASHEHEYDEHVWTSPVNAAAICREIASAMCAADEKNSEVYNKNCADYVEKIMRLDESFRDIVASATRKTVIFGDRFPLLYFVREYGIEYKAAYPGCSSSTEPSPAVIAELIDTVKKENIPVVFKIELSNGNIADTISEATGAKVKIFYSCHNISKDDFNNGETYLSLMAKNIDSLKEALN